MKALMMMFSKPAAVLFGSAFSDNLVKYWGWAYPVLILVEVGFFVWWAMEIAPIMKKDAKEGRGQMMVFLMAAGFVFGVTYMLTDILQLFGITVAGGVTNVN